MSVVMMIGFVVNVSATEKEFSLIQCVENTRIESYSDFINLLAENNCLSDVSMYTYSLRHFSDHEVFFNVEVDYDRNTVEVDVVYELAEMNAESTMAYTQSGAAEHETYSDLGVLLYTVVVNGKFSYTSSTCSTISKSGSFTKGRFSLWSSTPSVTSGSITSSKAYARISGTATLLSQSSSYRLTLMCDTNGKLTTSFTRP